MRKMLNPNTTLWVIDADQVADPKQITAETLNDEAFNFSCAVTRGYTLNPTDSDTDDTASICDSGNVANRLYDNYEGEITIFRDAVRTDNASVFNEAFDYWRDPDRAFYIFRRLGKRNNVAATDGDELEAFLFVNDNIRSVDGGDNGPVQATIPLLAQGNMTGYFWLGGTAPVGGPVVTSALPSGAAETETVTLTGSGLTGATGVTVGGVAGTSLTVVSDTSATFAMPAGSAGSAPIVVTTAAGSSTPFAYTRGA